MWCVLRSRTTRILFVSTLLTACGGLVALTASLFWPALYRSWTARRLIYALKSGDRAAAAAIETDQGYDASIIAFSDAIMDRDTDVSETALMVLSELIGRNVAFGYNAKPLGTEAKGCLLAALCDKLQDPDIQVRRNVAGIVAASGLGSDAVRLLQDFLVDEDEGVRRLAAEFLGEIGSNAREVVPSLVPSLVQSLQDKDKEVRASAATALGRIGPDSELVIPSLIEALRDPHNDVRAAAARSLGRVGSAAIGAVPALVNAVNDEHGRVRQDARAALKNIGPSAASDVEAP